MPDLWLSNSQIKIQLLHHRICDSDTLQYRIRTTVSDDVNYLKKTVNVICTRNVLSMTKQ